MIMGTRRGTYAILNDFYAGDFFLKGDLHFQGVKIALFEALDDALQIAVFGYGRIAAGIVAMGSASCSDRERF